MTPALDIPSATDREIEAAVAQFCAGWKWVSTGYESDAPPRPRWLELVDPKNLPYDKCFGWTFFPERLCPEPCNRRDSFVTDYLTDANAVLALLEKCNCDCIFDADRQWQVVIHTATTGKFFPNYSDKSFCRAACIALLRASGASP